MKGNASRFAARLAVAALVLLLTTAFLPAGTTSAADPAWRGEYFANQYLVGMPTLIRYDLNIAFDWGNGAPAPGLPQDHFSVRWSRQAYFPGGPYRFFTRSDDGVRLFVDGWLVIDRWLDSAAVTNSALVNLSAGEHALRLEYYDNVGAALVQFWWEPKPAPPPAPHPPPAPGDSWRGEYFTNPTLAGAPRVVRSDPAVDFDWGLGSPDPAIPPDNFSARWTRSLYFDAGRYNFKAQADDGVRLYIDGRLFINEWHPAAGRTYSASIMLTGGVHYLRVEYYEAYGDAFVRVWWDQPPSDRPVGNLITCARPHDSWIHVYRGMPDGSWQDMNPKGFGPTSASGHMKIDGLPVDGYYGGNGQPYRVELWAGGRLIRSVGGQWEFRIYSWTDNYTPWGCPAP